MENYQIKMEEEIKKISLLEKKPRLLLHACCAPCSSYVLEILFKYFDITIYYYNPNIYPYEEFKKRIDEEKYLVKEIASGVEIKIVEGSYENDKFNDLIKGLELEKEGSSRCYKCYLLRLEETAKYAKDNNFNYFTTTLSISPYKNSSWLNEIGIMLEDKYNIKYLFADFKKKNGYKRSIELSTKYNLYRQNYCGCIYSKKT